MMSERKACCRMKPQWKSKTFCSFDSPQKRSNSLLPISQNTLPYLLFFSPALETRALLSLQKSKALPLFLTFIVAPFARVEVVRAAVGLPDRLALVDGRDGEATKHRLGVRVALLAVVRPHVRRHGHSGRGLGQALGDALARARMRRRLFGIIERGKK